MDAEQARALLAEAGENGGSEDDGGLVHLPEGVLKELTLADLPEEVEVGVGELIDGITHVDWPGCLFRTGDALSAKVDLGWTKKYWSSPIGLAEYLDLVRRAIEKRERTHGDASVIAHDDDDEPWVQLVFELTGLPTKSLGDALSAARKRTDELIEPAQAAEREAGRVISELAQRLDGWGALPFDALLDQIDSPTNNANTKGRVLEELTARLFETVPGLSAIGRVRTATEEIDVTLLNGSTDPRFIRESAIMLVECKNWSSKCGKDEFVVFRSKIKNRSDRCVLGFLVSWNGFTSTITAEMMRDSHERELIVPLEGRHLREAVRTGDFAKVLHEAWQRAVML